MKTKILSFFLVLAPAVPALFCSACRPEPRVEPVVGFSINVPDWFDLGNGEFKEDGGRVEQPYGLWSGGFDEFKTAITGTKHYESGGSNTIDNDELTITCSGSGYRTMEANEDEGYTVTVAWEDYSIRFTLIVRRAVVDVEYAQLDWSSFAYDGEVKSPKLVNVWYGAKESECNTEVPEGVIAYSGNENAEVENIRFGRLSTTKTIEFGTVKTILTDGSSPLNGKLCNRPAEIIKFKKESAEGRASVCLSFL